MRVAYRYGVFGWVKPLREEMEEPLKKLSRALVLILLFELSRDLHLVVLKVHVGLILAVALELLAQKSVLVVLDVLLAALVAFFDAQQLEAGKHSLPLEVSDEHQDYRVGIQLVASHACKGLFIPKL
jgi:hypothetical protein